MDIIHDWKSPLCTYSQDLLFLDPARHLYLYHGYFKYNKPKVNFSISSLKPELPYGFSILAYGIPINYSSYPTKAWPSLSLIILFSITTATTLDEPWW